jgi:hypothetical protein
MYANQAPGAEGAGEQGAKAEDDNVVDVEAEEKSEESDKKDDKKK